jgi:putative membrane protein
MRRLCGYVTLALVCAAVTFAYAQATQLPGRKLSDQDFVKKAATCGIGEVKISELAVRKASDPKVKAFAEEMVRHHKQCNEKLTDTAKAAGITFTAAVDRDIQGTLDGLNLKSGADFDRAYMTRMVQDHEKAVNLFQSEAKDGTNGDLKKFASDTLPKLQEHLKKAREIADGLK